MNPTRTPVDPGEPQAPRTRGPRHGIFPRLRRRRPPQDDLSSDVRALLDHIAAEPARARARLADAPVTRPRPAPDPVSVGVTVARHGRADPAIPAGPPTGEPAGKTRPEPDPWWLRGSLNIAVWALTAVTTAVGSTGQVSWAEEEIGKKWHDDPRALAAPAGLELLFVALLLLGVRSARHGGSLLLYWLAAAAAGGFAVYTNTQHQGAQFFASLTAATLVLWFFKLRDELRRYQRDKKRRTSGRPAFGLLWIFEHRLARRAWRIALRRQVDNLDEALRLAERYRLVESRMAAATITATRGRKGKLVTRPRYDKVTIASTAWAAVCEAAGDPPIKLPDHIDVQSITVADRPAPPPVKTDDDPAEDYDPVPDTVPPGWTAERPRRRRAVDPVSGPPADLAALCTAKRAKLDAVIADQRARGEDWRTVRLSGRTIDARKIPGCRNKTECNLLARLLDYERAHALATTR